MAIKFDLFENPVKEGVSRHRSSSAEPQIRDLIRK